MRIPFTRENAAEFARRATASRVARLAAERAARENPPEPANPPSKSLDAPNPYQSTRLSRVRSMMNALDKKIASMIEDADAEVASAIDRLVSAQARLAEQERVLSGRPLPGSLRPRAAGSRARSAATGPLAEEGIGSEDGTPIA